MEKNIRYKRAYKELYEIISNLPKKERNRIPLEFIKSLKVEMDKLYCPKYDKEKPIYAQKIMVETKALFMQMYSKYIANEKEKEIFEKYEKICNNMIEEEKRKKYHQENNSIF